MYRDSIRRAQEATKKNLTCCQGCSIFWLYFLNGHVAFIGVFLLCFVIIQGAATGDLVEAVGEAGLNGALFASGLLVATAVIGMIGTAKRSKRLLAIYIFHVLGIAGALIGVGILFIFLVEDLGNIEGAASADLAGQVEGRLNDFLIAVFNKCCAEEFDGVEKLLGCSEDGAILEGCFTFEETYDAALDRVENTGLCTVLENTEVEVEVAPDVIQAVPVVGDPAVGGCSAGNGVIFKAALTELLEDNLESLGVVFTGFGVLLLLSAVASCVIICANKDEYFKEQNKDDDAYASSNNLPPPNAYTNYGSNPQYKQYPNGQLQPGAGF